MNKQTKEILRLREREGERERLKDVSDFCNRREGVESSETTKIPEIFGISAMTRVKGTIKLEKWIIYHREGNSSKTNGTKS